MEQSEALAVMLDITHSDDVERCTALLERANWNVDNAIALFYGQANTTDLERRSRDESVAAEVGSATSPGTASVSTSTSPREETTVESRFSSSSSLLSATSTSTATSTSSSSAASPTPTPAPPRGWWARLWLFGTYLLAILPTFFTSLWPWAQVPVQVGNRNRNRLRNGRNSSENYLAEFESKYGMDNDDSDGDGPLFQRGSWIEALKRGLQRDGKFVFVYVHSHLHEDCDLFASRVLGDPRVRQFLKRRFVCWFADVRSSDGLQVQTLLKSQTFPCCAVVTLRGTTQRASSGAMAYQCVVLDMVEGRISEVDTFLARYNALLQTYVVPAAAPGGRGAHAQHPRGHQSGQPRRRGGRAAPSPQQMALDEDRLIREQQEEAYQASLRADRARAESAAREAAERERLADEQSRREREDKQHKIRLWKALQKKRIALQRVLEHAESASKENVAYCMIRLASGAKLKQKFPADVPLQCVFDFVDTQWLSTISTTRDEDDEYNDDNDNDDDNDDDEASLNWKDAKTLEALDALVEMESSPYALVTNYPKRTFCARVDGSITLREAGFVPQATLFVAPLDQ